MKYLSIFILREGVLCYFFIDTLNFFIIALLFSKYFFESLNFINLISFLLLFIPWIAINYIFDKNKFYYDSFLKIALRRVKKNFSINLLIFITTNIFLNFNIVDFEFAEKFKLISREFYFLLFLSNCIIQLIFDYLIKYCFKYKEKWLCIGDFDINEYSNTNEMHHLSFTYINDSEKEKYNKEILNNFNGIIILDSSIRENVELANHILCSNNYKVYKLSKWCEKYLKKIPSELLLEKEIEKDFKSHYTKKVQLKIKRLGDIILSLFLLLLSLPIILIVGILIKLEDNGPIFYSQERIGLNYSSFMIFKLRSMKINAEKDKVQWSFKNDPRVTFIGKFIRKTRIDEIPQLWSVLKGEMSLIGPRPERPEFYDILENDIPNFRKRCSLKPGLSGWAQVNYPYGSTIKDASKKLSYDIYYSNNFSNLLDAFIMIKTIKVILRFRGT